MSARANTTRTESIPARQIAIGSRLAPMRGRREGIGVYAVQAIDGDGRVRARVVVDALGWVSSDLLRWSVFDGLICVSRPGDRLGITRAGCLRLPAQHRRATRLVAGDRVLLAAHLGRGVLIIVPPGELDAIAGDRLAAVAGADES